jgi:hypothetical protein
VEAEEAPPGAEPAPSPPAPPPPPPPPPPAPRIVATPAASTTFDDSAPKATPVDAANPAVDCPPPREEREELAQAAYAVLSKEETFMVACLSHQLKEGVVRSSSKIESKISPRKMRKGERAGRPTNVRDYKNLDTTNDAT